MYVIARLFYDVLAVLSDCLFIYLTCNRRLNIISGGLLGFIPFDNIVLRFMYIREAPATEETTKVPFSCPEMTLTFLVLEINTLSMMLIRNNSLPQVTSKSDCSLLLVVFLFYLCRELPDSLTIFMLVLRDATLAKKPMRSGTLCLC